MTRRAHVRRGRRELSSTYHHSSSQPSWKVQKVLGHEWATTTVRYMASAHAEPALECTVAGLLAAPTDSPIALPFWRGRLDSVSGWSIGKPTA
ncbi:hypothetical protein SAMN02787118_14163 [Streptomyces mirabilis]|jgi:hypothetical protein|uniref:Phage integrase family protein n=1 Tax=Streptomyces mirabilis TaxID=68239 RepID=A0A1I2X1T1_9ACTN|nr:hypothetical protein SAMN02787118_14163 [Streptomyces mirabilis]